DFHVTGVQTCALPIFADRYRDAGLVLHAAEAYALTVRLPGASEAIVRRARHSATQLLETIGPVHHALLGKLTTPPDTALTKREQIRRASCRDRLESTA